MLDACRRHSATKQSLLVEYPRDEFSGRETACVLEAKCHECRGNRLRHLNTIVQVHVLKNLNHVIKSGQVSDCLSTARHT